MAPGLTGASAATISGVNPRETFRKGKPPFNWILRVSYGDPPMCPDTAGLARLVFSTSIEAVETVKMKNASLQRRPNGCPAGAPG